jgi:hypothetical protein
MLLNRVQILSTCQLYNRILLMCCWTWSKFCPLANAAVESYPHVAEQGPNSTHLNSAQVAEQGPNSVHLPTLQKNLTHMLLNRAQILSTSQLCSRILPTCCWTGSKVCPLAPLRYCWVFSAYFTSATKNTYRYIFNPMDWIRQNLDEISINK